MYNGFWNPILWRNDPWVPATLIFQFSQEPGSFLSETLDTPFPLPGLPFPSLWPDLLCCRRASLWGGGDACPHLASVLRQAQCLDKVSNQSLSIEGTQKRQGTPGGPCDTGSHSWRAQWPVPSQRQPCVILVPPIFLMWKLRLRRAGMGTQVFLAVTPSRDGGGEVLRRTWGKALGTLLQSREGKWGLLLPEIRPSGSGQATLNSIKTHTVGATEWRSGEKVSSPSLGLCKLWQSSPVEGVL